MALRLEDCLVLIGGKQLQKYQLKWVGRLPRILSCPGFESCIEILYPKHSYVKSWTVSSHNNFFCRAPKRVRIDFRQPERVWCHCVPPIWVQQVHHCPKPGTFDQVGVIKPMSQGLISSLTLAILFTTFCWHYKILKTFNRVYEKHIWVHTLIGT